MAKFANSLLRDFRFATRMMQKNWSFTAIAVLTLALGIGANTAIFSVVNSVLLKPLPYARPMELAMIWSSFQQMGATRAPAAGAQLQELRTRSKLFQDVAGIWAGNATLVGTAEPEQIKLGNVTANFFSVLGVQPALGRIFQPEDEGQGAPIPVIIISHGLWQRRFGGNPNIIGQQIRFDSRSATVVGILRPDFVLAFPPDASVPMNIEVYTPFPKGVYAGKTSYFLRLLARLKPGVTLTQAQQEADAIAQQLRNDYREYKAENLQFNVVQLHNDVVREIKPALIALFIGAGLVLVISCFNITNLLLTRANTRRKEVALRTAIGASRWHIAQQLLSESVLLCCLGGLLGLGLGWLGLKLLLNIQPEGIMRVGAIKLDLTVLVFVTIVSVGCGILAGLAPIFETRKVNLSEALKEEARSSAGRGKNRVRTLLIVTEVALGFVLLISAGLMIRTLIQIQRVSPGFNPDNVLTFELDVSSGFRTPQDRVNFVTQWEEKLLSLPGVEAVGAISHLPLDDYPSWYSPYAPQGLTEDQKQNLLSDYRAVTPNFFQAMRTRLISGRYFNDQDNAAGKKVIIIDETLARKTWPNESAIGKQLEVEPFPNAPHILAEVVGVVEHIKNYNLLKPVRGEVFWPYAQCTHWHLSYAVKAKGDPLALITPIRRELDQINKNKALSKVRPMQHYVTKAMAPTTFTAALAGIFAVLALLLATIGIYGVVSYSVSLRTQELGVRMALGARPVDILRLVMKEGLQLTSIGLTIGVVASIALSKFIQNLLFGVAAIDPMTYVIMLAVIPAATLFACWRPAQRAASGSAMDALRQ